MKWVIIKGVRYPNSVISAFAAYNMDNPFLKIRIRNKYHIVPFDDVNKMASQMVYLMNNYPDFIQIGRWWISKKTVMSWVPKGQAVDGSGWVISFTLSFGLDNGTQIKFDEEGEYLSEIDRLNELFNVILGDYIPFYTKKMRNDMHLYENPYWVSPIPSTGCSKVRSPDSFTKQNVFDFTYPTNIFLG